MSFICRVCGLLLVTLVANSLPTELATAQSIYFIDNDPEIMTLGNAHYEVGLFKSNGNIADVTDKSTSQQVTLGYVMSPFALLCAAAPGRFGRRDDPWMCQAISCLRIKSARGPGCSITTPPRRIRPPILTVGCSMSGRYRGALLDDRAGL